MKLLYQPGSRQTQGGYSQSNPHLAWPRCLPQSDQSELSDFRYSNYIFSSSIKSFSSSLHLGLLLFLCETLNKGLRYDKHFYMRPELMMTSFFPQMSE